MKTLAELKEMSFIPHHDCSLCRSMVGWVVSKDALRPYFDPSCDCGGSEGHYDTWEDVFKWYNTVFEKETEEAVQAAWNKEADGCKSSSEMSGEAKRSDFAKNTSDIIEIFRSNGVVITEGLCYKIALLCQAIFKAGLEEGRNKAFSQYEKTFIAKMKDISEKLNGTAKEFVDALCESMQELNDD